LAAPHLVHVFASFDPDAAQLRTVRLIRHFAASYRHTIVTLDRRARARELLPGELDVGVVGPPPGSGAARATRLRPWLGLLGPDLILSYGWGAIEAAVANRWPRLAPHIHHEDAGDDDLPDRSRVRAVVRGLVLATVERVVVTTAAAEQTARRAWGLGREQVVRITCGVEAAAGEALAPIPGFERQPGEVVVGTVSTMRDTQALLRLLRALTRVQHGPLARLVIIGDGPGRGELVEAIVGLGLEGQTVLPGLILDPGRCMGHFDVYAGPSSGGRACALQAMAAGLPLIGPDVGGLEEIVSEPNRDFMIDPLNEAALAARLDALLRDAQLRARLGRANRAKVLAEHDFALMAQAYRALYDEMLRRERRRPEDGRGS
jgi:L-malate glycosyltransferase